MGHRVWLVALLTIAAGACRATADEASPAAPSGPPATTTTTLGGRSPTLTPVPDLIGFDGARILDDEGGVLLVSFTGGAEGTGPCTSTYSGGATETTTEVVVRLRARGSGADITCPALGYARTVPLELAKPLGERRLIDASTATEVGVLRVPMPTPTSLPDGWTAKAEWGRAGSWTVSYGIADSPKHVTVTVGPANPSPLPPNSTVTDETTVQGRAARWVLPGSVGYDELVLADDRYSVVLAPSGLDRSTVERIAESLQPLPIARGAPAPTLPG